MKKTISMFSRHLLCALMIFSLCATVAYAQESPFKRLQLAHGISLEIPSHWKILSQDTRNNLEAAGAAMLSNSGLESSGRKQNLLAVNAIPEPTGAMIRVSVTSPPDYTQAELASTSPKELKEIERELVKLFKQMESSGGPKIIEMQTVRIVKVKEKYALVIPYVRSSLYGPSNWQVTQYKIPVSNKLIELTLSHRQSDSIVWKPILEKVLRSIQF